MHVFHPFSWPSMSAAGEIFYKSSGERKAHLTHPLAKAGFTGSFCADRLTGGESCFLDDAECQCDDL